MRTKATVERQEISLDEIAETLALAMTNDEAATLIQECLGDAGLADIDTVERLRAFAKQLILRGGLAKSVGFGLKVSADLRCGAK